jgi:hypothetical protein
MGIGKRCREDERNGGCKEERKNGWKAGMTRKRPHPEDATQI